MSTTTWHLSLPFTRPPLTLNMRHSHWSAERRISRQIRQTACVLARAQRIPPCARIAVELHYQQRARRRIDGDNLMATVKPCVDGLRDAGVVVDDDSTRVVHHSPVVHEPEPGQRHGLLWLVVRDLSSEPTREAMP